MQSVSQVGCHGLRVRVPLGSKGCWSEILGQSVSRCDVGGIRQATAKWTSVGDWLSLTPWWFAVGARDDVTPFLRFHGSTVSSEWPACQSAFSGVACGACAWQWPASSAALTALMFWCVSVVELAPCVCASCLHVCMGQQHALWRHCEVVCMVPRCPLRVFPSFSCSPARMTCAVLPTLFSRPSHHPSPIGSSPSLPVTFRMRAR